MEEIIGVFIRHTSCEKCGSSDGKAMYEDGSHYCWVCKDTKPSDEYIAENSDKPQSKVKRWNEKGNTVEVKPSNKPAMTTEEYQKIKDMTTTSPGEWRGIRDETNAKFGVRYSIDEDEQIISQYCPVTQDGQLVGVKIRDMPKTFYSQGRTGLDCELFMQFKFNRGGKYIVITEGEVDALSAFQMLNDYNKSKGWDYETAVVSPTVGSNSQRQIAGQYRFFDTFENIILCFDNDKAGQDALEEVVKVLPKGKVKIMTMRYKDANEYLTKGKSQQFLNDFYDAKPYTPVGVLGSGQLYDKIIEQASITKVPFPPFMRKLNDMMIGGIPLGHIINIAAGTGLGKTTYITEIVYHWIFHSEHKIGIVSMELDAGQYGETLLSRHLSRKLALIKDKETKQRVLVSDDTRAKAKELFYSDDDQHRFYLLDNRDGSIEEIQNTIEELVVSCGCKIIVLDPLQDVLDGLSNEDQALFMKWCKGLIKSHGVTIILINHVRKSASGAANSSEGNSFTEEEIQGSSTIIKSASFNILLSRNKYSEDPIERNTTKVLLSKNRIYGLTGPAGEVYYENETNTLHDKEEYFA